MLHRDRDLMTEDEVDKWKTDVRALLVEPYVTAGRDIESCFINSKVLADLNPDENAGVFDALIAEVAEAIKAELIKDYVNGRIDIARKSGKSSKIDHGALAVEANAAVSANKLRYCGKTALRALRTKFQTLKAENLLVYKPTKSLVDNTLTAIAKKSFKKPQSANLEPTALKAHT
jgi:hypothetical protein